MTIITFVHKEQQIDIGINRDQKIIDTLHILASKGFVFPLEETYVTIQRNGKKINSGLSYEEAGVYSGDRLSFN